MNISLNEAEVCEDITQTLEQTSTVHVTTTLDTNSMSKAAGYYNFASYSLLAGAIFVICLVLTSFQGLPIRKRITISSMIIRSTMRSCLHRICYSRWHYGCSMV